MLTLKTSAHIRTIRHSKSFRSCPNATGVSMAHLDLRRILLEEKRLAWREGRRLWRNQEWSEHLERLSGPLRVLPPSARSGQRMAE